MKQKRTLVVLVVSVLLGGCMAWGIARLLEWSNTGAVVVGIGVAVAMAGVVASVAQAPAETQWAQAKVDAINIWAGKIVGWLIFPLFLLMTFEVIMRYIFNSPNVWSLDVTCMLYGTLWVMGCPYALAVRRHIRVDPIYERLSLRTQSIIDVVGWIVLFFPMGIALFFGGLGRAQLSWAEREIFEYAWTAPAYPFRTVLPIAMFLMLLQGVSELVRSLFNFIKGEQL